MKKTKSDRRGYFPFLGFVLVATVFLMVGCASIDADYAKADRETMDFVLPEYLDMSENAWRKLPDGNFEPWVGDKLASDGSVLTTRDERLQTRRDVGTAWDYRVNAAEGAYAPDNGARSTR